MIVSKLFAKFKSFLFGPSPYPGFIINPTFEKANARLYDENLSSQSYKLNINKYCIYSTMYFELCILSRAFNNRDNDPAPDFFKLLNNVLIPIGTALQFNQQYAAYVLRENHNITLNSLIDKTYTPRLPLTKLVHTEEERELLLALQDRISRRLLLRNVDKNLLVEIRDVIKQLSPDNYEMNQDLKDPILDAIAKGRGRFTHEQAASIEGLEANIVRGRKYSETLYEQFSKDLIRLQQVNEYLEAKLS